ncbi:type II toxin-antitoxin system RelE/ParE family toxin [Atlantibacter subterranea]|uniref:Type II toxin-antitoxin system RelE/ParE family toxin n=1 Tax=Atlantibacter subterraneus TaxID=255519 RepID=A0A3R9GNX6_9ENTR|nr:type II toxin-antitoxin system RelE/ParE family toxin [Atlantibacter subterranea]RSB61540.1 type II toxin-antitoxin system RelE/ParE family toxin [Atlantibacter subterranea]RSE04657.1 type II toxin-antitoxin system RelE/ParE family toxin [Atlantibacter subterranea]RSE24474.1 type II toxin-antitoxin system RelE/ParE family toxin [Atlantibacter subterranea]
MVQVEWSKRAVKQLQTIDTRYRKAIWNKVSQLETFPDVSLDLKKLEAPGKFYRLRVGDYRIIFEIIDGVPTVCKIQEVKRRTSQTY